MTPTKKLCPFNRLKTSNRHGHYFVTGVILYIKKMVVKTYKTNPIPDSRVDLEVYNLFRAKHL